jgi:intein-encoded DNA endonuclease-like protein
VMEATDAPMQPQHGGKEEVKKTDNITKKKRREIAPRHLRVKAYRDALKLRKRGLTQIEISNGIHRRYGIWIDRSTIGRWVRGESSPYNGTWIPSPELLKPSEDLAYVISVLLGDGFTCKDGYDYIVGLEAKDKEFVEEFGRRLGNVLGREPIRPRFREDVGKYVVEARSKVLYELLNPIDLNRIKKYIEHCPKCVAAFIRGFFDSEGCVDKNGYLTVYNTNYEVLVYIQKLLKKYFKIEATGPWLSIEKGTPTRSPKNGKIYMTTSDCYYLYIRAKDLLKFYRHIGFSIRRRQKRLEEYLRRTGKL